MTPTYADQMPTPTPDTTQRFVAGNAAQDADRLGRDGWIAGVFFADDETENARTAQDLEVKHWAYPRGGGQCHPPKVATNTEWTMILSGSVLATVGGEHLTLNAGDYVLIHPGTPNNVVQEVLEDTVGITVKSPSDPTAKTVLPRA